MSITTEFEQNKTKLGELTKLFTDLGGVRKVGESLRLMANSAQREKTRLVNSLVSNSNCAFSRTDLEKFDSATLGKLAATITPNSVMTEGNEALFTLEELNGSNK